MSNRLETCLTHGRAPAYWQRQIAQDTAWLDAVTRNCAWLAEVTAVQVTLNDTPLLGQALVTLTTQLSQANQANQTNQANRQNSAAHETSRLVSAAAASRVTPSAKHEHSGNGNALKRFREQESRFPGEAHETPSRQTNPSVAPVWQSLPGNQRASHQIMGLERRVERVLLRRWVGEEDAENLSRSRPTVVLGKGQRNVSIHPLPIQRQIPSLHDWQETLVKRASHVLHNADQAADRESMQEEMLRTRLWNTPLGGPTAPADLLLSLTRLCTISTRASATAGRGERELRRSSSDLDNQTVRKPVPTGVGSPDEGVQAVQACSTSPQEVQAHSMSPAVPLEGADIHNQALLRSLLADAQVEQIMPPVAEPQLPPLTVSRQVDIPSQPVAVATLRLGAQAEMKIDDDLDVLAAKIKRILDDEARRHGIDV